ncbi:MAG: TilS substrate C-terminal domain-containing protein, partial [Pseudomonadota bacterium]
DIPAWERSRLPVVSVGRQVLFAAGVGMDCNNLVDEGASRWRLRWQAV